MVPHKKNRHISPRKNPPIPPLNPAPGNQTSLKGEFLPVTRDEMTRRGWNQCDFILVTGDAYVDHPGFGAAVIGRVLENAGFSVGIIPQPRWDGPEDFRRLGRPRLAFLISSGNLDSMVNHYTTMKKRRREDAYSPGGVPGLRPDRACIVYTSRARQAFRDVPVILGGIEASLRRLSHYDYWTDRVRRSILLDAKADLLIYGMGEKPILEVAFLLAEGTPVRKITGVRGTVRIAGEEESSLEAGSLQGTESLDTVPDSLISLPSFEMCAESKTAFAESFRLREAHSDPLTARPLMERAGGRTVIQNPSACPLSTQELDRIYELPYLRRCHPFHEAPGGKNGLPAADVPALREVSFSLVSSRGCFGGCSFCAIGSHQGRVIQSRSHESLLRETEMLVKDPGFKGYIHDVGGPTANFRIAPCRKQKAGGSCPDRQCLSPEPCASLTADHTDYISLLGKLRGVPGIKKVFIRSGIRYDYLLMDKNDTFLRELCLHHVSGQLKVAPEHVVPKMLRLMGKPGVEAYDTFQSRFGEMNKSLGKKQFLVPYFISAHPGSTLEDAIALAVYLKKSGLAPDQVQDFYPTPGTLSTCMYYTGIDPRDGKPVYVPKDPKEKLLQKALIHFHKPENRKLVAEALRRAGRTDLIGTGPDALIGPDAVTGKEALTGQDVRTNRAAPSRPKAPGRRRRR